MKTGTLKDYTMQIVSLCGLISCSLGICSNVQGVFFTEAAKDLHVMVGTFSMQNTVACIITYILAIYFAEIAEKVNYQKMLLTGAVMTGISFVAMGAIRNLIVFYILGIVRGIGASVFAVAIVTIGIQNWFKEKTGFVTSLVFCTSGITGMVLSPLFAWIMEHFSWRVAYVIMGSISFLLILPAICSGFTLKPQQKGMQPYGKEQAEKREQAGASVEKSAWGVFGALAGIAVLYNLILGFSQHLPGYGESIGMSATQGAFLLSLCMFGNVVFKLFSGIISDRCGAVKTTNLMVGINLVSVILLFALRVLWLQETCAFLFGVMYSVITVCLSLTTLECCGGTEYSRVFPKISMVGGIANPVAVSLLGYVYDLSGSYNAVFLLLFVFHAVGILLLLYLYNRSRRYAE